MTDFVLKDNPSDSFWCRQPEVRIKSETSLKTDVPPVNSVTLRVFLRPPLLRRRVLVREEP